MPTSRRFKLVDVFTQRPFAGNPVAVILDAEGLADVEMQRIANWTNLSETTFVLPPSNPEADYRVRIFTPRAELPFAGHPTLGTAHAALDVGLVSAKAKLIQECGAGLVPLAVVGEGAARSITLELPPAKTRLLDDAEVAELEVVLGAPVERAQHPRVIDVGPRWVVARMRDAVAVRDVRPEFGRMAKFEHNAGATGVTVFGTYPSGQLAAIEVRSFAPSHAILEDPVCGSGNGSVGVFLRDTGFVETVGRNYLASQGSQVGRDGRVSVAVHAGGAIHIGGHCVTCVDGTLTI